MRRGRRILKADQSSWLATCTLVVVALVFALAASETIVRETARVASWTERNGFGYARQPTHFGRLLTRPPGTDLVIHQPEFEFRIRTNREGLRDIDHPLAKSPAELRIAVLGDSFTEGQGAPFEDSFPQVLGRLVQAELAARRITVLQGGCAGSDPVWETFLLADRLLAYDPDWILLVLNGTDVGDLRARGGFDRVEVGMPSPRWEWLFARSHLARLVLMRLFGFDWMGRSPAEAKARNRLVVPTVLEAARRIERLAGPKRRVAIVTHPTRPELEKGHYAGSYAAVLRAVAADGHVLIDLLPALAARVPVGRRSAIYWPLDGHFTPEGYLLVARAVYAELHTELGTDYARITSAHGGSTPRFLDTVGGSVRAAGRPGHEACFVERRGRW